MPLHGCNVVVQVQYPDAQQTMMTDLSSIRRWAGFLQKTEIKFDMLSAVDELSKQVRRIDQIRLPVYDMPPQNAQKYGEKVVLEA